MKIVTYLIIICLILIITSCNNSNTIRNTKNKLKNQEILLHSDTMKINDVGNIYFISKEFKFKISNDTILMSKDKNRVDSFTYDLNEDTLFLIKNSIRNTFLLFKNYEEYNLNNMGLFSNYAICLDTILYQRNDTIYAYKLRKIFENKTSHGNYYIEYFEFSKKNGFKNMIYSDDFGKFNLSYREVIN